MIIYIRIMTGYNSKTIKSHVCMTSVHIYYTNILGTTD